MAFCVASWNVNSVRKRQELLVAWLEHAHPDILLLQELKCEETQFPRTVFEAAGYEALVVGQKAYNGVAILHKKGLKIQERERVLPNEESGQARYLEVEVGAWIFASLYLPNGNPLTDKDKTDKSGADKNGAGTPSEKFRLKLQWMECLLTHAERLRTLERPTVLGGDYNIIPTARDCVTPADWQDDALFHPESRRVFRKLLNAGWTDALDDLLNKRTPSTEPPWTYWSYQGGAFDSDDGIRIDHMLLSPEAADHYKHGTIDRTPRAEEGASDHTPVLVHFTDKL